MRLVFWHVVCCVCAGAGWVLTPPAIAFMWAVKRLHALESHASMRALYARAVLKAARRRQGAPR